MWLKHISRQTLQGKLFVLGLSGVGWGVGEMMACACNCYPRDPESTSLRYLFAFGLLGVSKVFVRIWVTGARVGGGVAEA